MHWTKGEYQVSDEKSLLRVSAIRLLMQQGEWCSGYSEDKIRRLVQKSYWLGLYLKEELIGLARVVTDMETVALVTDFIIDEQHRRHGLGSWLMECLVNHPELRRTSMSLGTQDGDRFFNKFGFERNGGMMHRFPLPDRAPHPSSRPVGFPPKGSAIDRKEDPA